MHKGLEEGGRLVGAELLWLLGSLCQLHRIPFDPLLVERQFPPPYSGATLHAALLALGFKVGALKLMPGSDGIRNLPFPVIGFLKDGPSFSENGVPDAGSPEHAKHQTLPAVGSEMPSGQTVQEGALPQGQPIEQPAVLTPALIINADGERILYFRAGSQTPETAAIDRIGDLFTSEIMLVSRAETAKGTDGEHTGANDGVYASENKPASFGFRWFIPELLKHKRIWKEILLASLVIQLIGLATPLFTQVVIDKVVVHQTHSTLIVIALGMLMFMVFSSVMTWLRQYFVLHTGNRIDAVLGSNVFRHLLRLPLPYFEHRPTGTLVARLHGVETIREFVSGAAVSLLLDFPFLLIFLAVMFWYSWQLSLIALGILSLIAAMSFLVAPVFRAKLNHQFMLGARNQSFMTEYIAGMDTVKSLQMEPILEQRFGDYLSSYLASGFNTRKLANTYNVIANSLEQTMTLAILAVGALLVMRNDGFTIGMLVAFQMFAGRMSQPMLRLVGLWQEFQQASIAVKRLGDIMDMPAEPYALTPARSNNAQGGLVELKDVSFRYSQQHPYLYRNLNLTFKPRHLSVLMGPSGCGKSTLAKLLLGFYQPADGQIKIDGADIRHLSANELRSIFGVVPQETVLFAGTIYDNLSMANPHATFEEIVQACRHAEIHEVIEGLPQGYQTPIGEHGVGLSGGQKQRIAIARALLKRPRILIFDEATSNLDQQTAEHFAATINRLKGRATILYIAHQLPAGLQVDEVVRLGSSGKQPQRMSVVEEEQGRD